MNAAAGRIGIFDSGLGGISVLREIRRELPRAQLIYYADSGHCPYGRRSRGEILARATLITEFLMGQGAQMIVVACNTATIAAVEHLRATYPLAFVGMEPAVKPAVAQTRSGVIGVLATGAALGGDKFHHLLAQHGQSVRIITQPCPGWVEQVEQGDLNSARTHEKVAQYVEPLIAQGADTLVLGCTHYPFLRPVIQRVAGDGVVLIDTGAAVARQTRRVFEREGLQQGRDACPVQWHSSGDPAEFDRVRALLWQAPLG